jgi:hypothetical protein
MIKKMKNLFFAATAMVLILPAVVGAQYNPTNPGTLPDSTSVNDIIIDVINWVLAFLASLSVLMIVVSGIMYITSGGDETRIGSAKKWLTYSIVGLVVALLSYVIVRTIGAMLGA